MFDPPLWQSLTSFSRESIHSPLSFESLKAIASFSPHSLQTWKSGKSIVSHDSLVTGTT